MQEVGIGSTAPDLPALTFVYGPPVENIEAGRLYVIHLWATWCGACPESLKQLDSLRKTYPDIALLSVAVLEPHPASVQAFVRHLDLVPAHSVAIDPPISDDAPPAGDPRPHGWMARHWFDAAYGEAVPFIFIVNRDRQIAWIGYVDEMEEPLKQIYTGTWDLDAQAKKYRASRDKNKTRERHALRGRLRVAHLNERFRDIVEAIDQTAKQDATLVQEEEFVLAKIDALVRMDGCQAHALKFAQDAVRVGEAYGPGFGMSVAATFLDAPVVDMSAAEFAVPLLLQSKEEYERQNGSLSQNDQIRFSMCAARGLAALNETSRATEFRRSTEKLIDSAALPEDIKDDMRRHLSDISSSGT